MEVLQRFMILSLVSVCYSYRKDGDFIIGAVLPLTTESGSGKCGKPNPLGIAAAEAFTEALEKMKQPNSEFTSLLKTSPIGYDIRDNCNDLDIERTIAYSMSNAALLNKKGNKSAQSVDIVLSQFTKDSLKTMKILNVEEIPQISFDANNARLMKDSTIQDSTVKMLASAYPENVKKILAITDFIQEFGFHYVHAVISDNYQGRAGSELLSEELKKKKIYSSDHMIVSSSSDITKAVSEFEKNKLITVVVVDCVMSMELELYKQVQAKGLKHLYFLSTQNWLLSEEKLKPFASVVEGMTYIQTEDQYSVLKDHFQGPKIQIPFTNKEWLKPLFFSKGGKKECLSGNVLSGSLKTECEEAQLDTQLALADKADMVIHSFVSTYVIAHAMKAKKQDETLLEAMKKLKFRIKFLNSDLVVFNDHLTAESSDFMLYNIHGNTSATFVNKWLGAWDQKDKLKITKSDLRWKGGSKDKPISTCAEMCSMGFKTLPDQKNCWTCHKCPNGTISNVTNADECFLCPIGTAASPDQTRCAKYKLIVFHWFGPMGSFLIFLIVLGVCAALFALGIFSQNSDHELVLLSGYRSLCLYALGCLLLFLSPIPLLVKPTVESCSCYIALFNLAQTFCFAVLFSRTALINNFYDDDGAVIKGGCGRFPRAVTMIIVIGIQLLIMAVGLVVEKPDTAHHETDKWDERYFECSSWSSFVFWIGFGYNIGLSFVGNGLSCSSTKMEENCEELKYILITFCVYYLFSVFEVVIFYRYIDSALAEGQGVMCILFGFTFLVCFLCPKIFIILFRSNKDGKSIQRTLVSTEDGEAPMHSTAIHAADAFRHHGVVQMKIKEDTIDED